MKFREWFPLKFKTMSFKLEALLLKQNFLMVLKLAESTVHL